MDLSGAEKALIVASVAVTLSLFGYLGYEAMTSPPGAAPRVLVEPADSGAWVVLANDGSAGIAQASVRASCGGKELFVDFANVPADARRRAHVACAEGAVEAELASWMPA